MNKYIRLLILISIIVIIVSNANAQNSETASISSNTYIADTGNVYGYFVTKFVFGSGFWVYQDTVTGETDSISIVDISHGYYGPNPAFNDYSLNY
jgi:hypothetical protein